MTTTAQSFLHSIPIAATHGCIPLALALAFKDPKEARTTSHASEDRPSDSLAPATADPLPEPTLSPPTTQSQIPRQTRHLTFLMRSCVYDQTL